MNATEQRTHRTVTASLDSRLSDVEVVTDRTARNLDVLRHEVIELATHVDRAHIALTARDDRLLDDLRVAQVPFNAFVLQSFWQRLRWLVRGE